MSEPTTPTGRRLLSQRFVRDIGPDILAIEREAAQQERERLRAMVLAEEDVHEPAVRFTLSYILDLLADPEDDA